MRTLRAGDTIRLRKQDGTLVHFHVIGYETHMDAFRVECRGEWDEPSMPTHVIGNEGGVHIVKSSSAA